MTHPVSPSGSLTRRDALKLAGASLALGTLAPQALAAAAPSRRPKKVIVAGAGIGGLCCAYELMERGHEVILLEASRRTGGHVKTMIKSLTFVTLAISASLAVAQPAVTRSTHTYKRVGELEIKADVHRLDDAAVRPVVVWLHGGALIMGGRERISKYLQQLASDGIIVVSIDYRLAPETKLPAIIEDVEDAFTWIRRRGPELFQADPKRIGVWGESAGGYLTLTTGFRVKPAPQALVSIYGYGDLIGDWYGKPSPHPAHQKIKMTEAEARAQVSGPPVANSRDRKGNGGGFYQFCRQRGTWPLEVSGWDPAKQPAKFHPFMAVKNVSPEYPPTFLAHGTADTDVPYEQSVMMARELQQHGVPHEFIAIENAEHGFRDADPAKVEAAYQAAIAFTKRHLTGP